MSSIVIIIDIDEISYWSHYSFKTIDEAMAFADGMMAAWKISHGQANCWRPFVLDNPNDFEEWEEMGFPGKTELESVIKVSKSLSFSKNKL